MITIEGLGGKGAVWCAVRFGVGMLTNVTHFDSYTKDRNFFLSAQPCSIYLPPVGSAAVWYSCATSPYGPRLSQVEIGTLYGVSTSPKTPNPCEHSTINGGLLAIGVGSSIPTWLKPTEVALDGQWLYCRDGSRAQFNQGATVLTDASYKKWAFDRKGVQVASKALATIYSMLTDGCNRLGSSNLFPHGAVYDEWYSTKPDFVVEKQVGLGIFKTYCTHESARIWKEVRWQEYHLDNSYTPFEPVSKDSGFGFCVAATRRERTITMIAIQSTEVTTFKGRYNCVETVTYWGWTQEVLPRYLSGDVTSEYTFDAPILTLSPGLASGTLPSKDKLDHYCDLAKVRAKLLYKCKEATIARSDALADVSGLDSNWIENLTQIKGTTDAIKPLINGWKAWKNHDIVAGKRALIDAYLSYMYCIAPGISDVKDVYNNIGKVSRNITTKRFSSERRRGQLKKVAPVMTVLADLAYFCTIDFKLKDNPLAAIFNALEQLGLNPSAANIWDLLPFSFVVDWFTNIGSTLSRLDAYENNAILRNVESRVETFKVLWPLTVDELLELLGSDYYSISCPFKYSWYDRRVLSGLGSFDPFSGQSFDGLSVSQMAQGTALLSSYKK